MDIIFIWTALFYHKFVMEKNEQSWFWRVRPFSDKKTQHLDMLIYAFLIPHNSLTLYGGPPCSNTPKLIQPHIPKPKQPHIPMYTLQPQRAQPSKPKKTAPNSNTQALNQSARHDSSDITVGLHAHGNASPAIAISPSWMAPSAVDAGGSVAC